MSYFVCGYHAKASVLCRLQRIIGEIKPAHVETEPLVIGTSPQLVLYGYKKVIPHLVIKHEVHGSWLAVVGTPLVRPKTELDTLRLLEDFLADPIDSLRRTIDGNFAVFAFDARSGRLYAATDLNNSTPVFYAATPHGFLLSSHELALAKLLTPEIDSFGFAQSVQLGVTWGSGSRFRGVSKLLPAQIVTVDRDGKSSCAQYWRPADEDIWAGSLDEQIVRWGALLREAVWKYYECANWRPVIADFTAGEDSRLILAQCHALGIPFRAHVKGSADDIDVAIAERAATLAGFTLIKRARHYIHEDELLANALRICLNSDAYLGYTAACTDYATDLADPLDDYSIVKFGGVPGGEAFRGSYYLRGKAINPSSTRPLDYKFFTRMKYLLDFNQGLLRFGDREFLDAIHRMVVEALQDVSDYPVGTQIDHLLRVFQTCCVGLMYKDPLYLPLAINAMTRSIYALAPSFKRGGRLTKACTEVLFPEVAVVRTQSGSPTVRRTARRQLLFIPRYIAWTKAVVNGASTRLYKWRRTSVGSGGEKGNGDVFKTLLSRQPYRSWLASADSMTTGQAYEKSRVEELLKQARIGSCRYTPTLGRVIGQELAMRWVYGEGLS